MNLDNLLQKTIRVSFCLLFIIIPLIFTPWNYELFEFNKMIAVYAFTSIIVGAWLGRMILAKKILIKKTPFDIPLLIFLFSQILSFLFSIDRYTSFWGYYSRFHGGLLSTICYLLLYWAFVANMNKKSTMFTIYCSLFTALLISFYGILEHYGHSFSCLLITDKFDVQCWIQDVRTRVFATLGQPNWLAAYLAVLIPITISYAINSKFEYRNSKQYQNPNYQNSRQNRFGFRFSVFGFSLLYLLLTLCFFYTKSQSGLFGLSASLVILSAGLIFINLKQKILDFKNLALSFLIITFIFIFSFNKVGLDAYPQISNLVKKFGLAKPPSSQTQVSNSPTATTPVISDASSPTGEIRKIVWKGAIEIWKHYPIFGSGVETFAYSYYNFRPIEHNFVSEWDFLYNKAHNEYLNFLATTGIVGLGSYLLLIGWFIFWATNTLIKANRKRINTNEQIFADSHKFADIRSNSRVESPQLGEISVLLIGLLSGYISILITNFFGFSVVPVALFFFLIPAFCVVLTTEESHLSPLSSRLTSRFSPPPLTFIQKLSSAILLLFTFYFLYFILNLWRADAHYAKGEKLDKSGRYDLAFSELMKAIELNKGEPVYRNEIADSAVNLALFAARQKDATSASNLTQLAILQSQQALKTSPRNLNFRKGQVKVLYALAQVDKSYFPSAIEALQQTILLAPTDPKLKYNLGIIYGNNNQPDLAINSFNEAIQLKPNYREARYALALYLKQAGKFPEAKEQLEYILKNLDPDDSQSAKLLDDLNRNSK